MGSYAAQGPRIAIDNFLSQWLVTDPGQLYQITFAADGFGWVFFGPYNFEFDSSEWATYTVYAPALYNGVDLTFLEYGSGSPNFNPGLLDAINVDVAPPDVLVAVPQPGTISLFASGLCGLALLQWRRKSKHLAA
jgi:hypothetical protein